MLLATIQNTANNRKWQITKCNGATAPACVTGCKTVCGYWETRFELFDWACALIGVNPLNCEWVDGFTGEVLDYDDLLSELIDIENEVI